MLLSLSLLSCRRSKDDEAVFPCLPAAAAAAQSPFLEIAVSEEEEEEEEDTRSSVTLAEAAAFNKDAKHC